VYTLITAATSAKAYQLKGSLNTTEVLLGDHLALPDTMIRSGLMVKLPNPTLDSYPHLMLALCLDKQVDTVYLLRTEEVLALANASQLFDEYGISLIKSDD
jgi:hypothetical protein